MPYSDLPEPKFAVGQTVWYADTTRENAKHACPDCRGAKVWKVETPAGGIYEVPCQRCLGGYTYCSHDDVPPLAYAVFVAAPRSMVVKAVEVRTNGHFGAGPEVYYDGREQKSLYATEEEAQAVSKLRSYEQNAKAQAEPQALAARNIAKLKIDEAKYDQFASGLWNAWHAYGSLVELLDEYLEGKESLGPEDVGYLKSDIRWEVEYRAKQDRPLDGLVAAVRSALAGDAGALQSAYDALPDALKGAPAAASEAEVV